MDAVHNKSFCTISTLDYMPYVYALHDSLKRYNADMPLDVLVVDADRDALEQIRRFSDMRIHGIDEICKSELGEKVFRVCLFTGIT